MTAADRPASYMSGWVMFSATLASVAGIFNLVYGLVVLFNDEWVVFTPDSILLFDLTTWGWILLVLGALQLLIAAAIANGQTWGRVAGILWAALVAVAQMAFLSVYPWWSTFIIVMSVLVIYGLTVHGDEVGS
jgi:hypothetical protein